MSEIKFVNTPPGFEPRDYKGQVAAAKDNPGKWIELPWPEDSIGSSATHCRKLYGLEARVRKVDGVRQIYVRYNP